MTRAMIIALAITAALALLAGISAKIYLAGANDVRAGIEKRAEGIRAEREVLIDELRNQTVRERCDRLKLGYVRDDQGERCT